MIDWTLQHNEQTRTLADWGLAEPRRRLRNQSLDTLRLREPGARVEGEPLFAPESTVQVFRDGVPFFRGIVVDTPRRGRGGEEHADYVLAGPWWHLENLVYQQSWQEAVDINSASSALAAQRKSSVILGQDDSGVRQSTGQAIRSVLSFATAQGAPFITGVVDGGVSFPPEEARDLSCAEAIQRLLRWTPDVVAWFDYTASPLPVLHLSRRSVMNAVTLNGAAASSQVRGLRVLPREDLRTPAVVVHYEKTHRSDEAVWTTTETDAFPPQSTGTEFKAIVLTVELDGRRANFLRQPLVVDPISESNRQWWKQHLPALEGIPIENIRVKDWSRTSDLPNELVEGNVAEWMNVEVEADVVRAKLSWIADDEVVIDREVTLRLNATDASTRTYRTLISSVPPEPTPSGVASRLHAALNPLQYEGEVELEAEEAGAQAYLGRVLNVTGLRAEWATMRGQVQQVDEDLERGRTRIVFGPAQHLGAADMVERLRVNRRRRASGRISTRTSGKPDDAPPVDQSTHGRLESASQGPGKYGRTTWTDPDEPLRRVVIDALTLPVEAPTVQLTQEDVCDGGVLRKRMVLASAPFDPLPPASA
ncbi:MAG: hypothetical protein ACFB20_12690 [Opitutales bacterium]